MFLPLTFTATLLGTTVRVLRTAAGRRVLHLALLVGGLFALGFVCGEQAHAADGTVPVPVKATSAGYGAVGHEGLVRPVRPVRHAQPAVPVRDVRTVGEQTVASARDVVTAVSRSASRSVYRSAAQSVSQSLPLSLPQSLAQAVSQTVSQSAETTRPPTTMHSLLLPDLGQGAGVPVLPVPGAQAPASHPRYRGGPAARPTAPAPRKHARAGARTAVTAPAPLLSYGPDLTPVPQNEARTSGHHGTAVGAPGRPEPTPDTDGVPGKQAVDGSASRHGDAHAVTFGNGAAPQLVPGAAARVDAPRTRERHRDIPVFPG